MSMPPSSPRLPSPPPPTEIQIGPKSPSVGSFSSQEPTIEQSIIDANAIRRIHPGTKAADMAAGPPLVPLGELDSAFQLQEHLKALHYHYTKSENDNVTPITRETALLIAAQPEGVDRALWLYELCRFLINKCNDLIIGFLFDDPPCSASTCPEMRASEWQFLCAVHESPKSCCAIDYCCHTLDWATNIVTSQKIFPSRLTLGAGDSLDPRGGGEKHLTNIFRRLHRMFAHGWFQHRGVFWQVEGQTGLYVLFKTVCDTYDLLPAENYKLPPEAEGLEPVEDSRPLPPSIMKSTKASHLGGRTTAEEDFMNVPPTHTRRHIRGSPSVGSAVPTVLESDEEDPDVTQKLREMSIDEGDGDDTIIDIPVVVETLAVDEIEEEEAQPEPINTTSSEPETSVAADILESGPPTSSLDKTFFDNVEAKGEEKEKLEQVDTTSLPVDASDSLVSPEIETPVVAKKDVDEDEKKVEEEEEKEVDIEAEEEKEEKKVDDNVKDVTDVKEDKPKAGEEPVVETKEETKEGTGTTEEAKEDAKEEKKVVP